MIIYKITNLINGKVYVGKTTRSINKRINEHKSKGTLVGVALLKYGDSNFTIDVLDTAKTKEELRQKERRWIGVFNCFDPHGYNRALGDSKFGEFNGFYGKRHQERTIKLNKEHQKCYMRILCVETGVIYDSVRECARSLGISRPHVKRLCCGEVRNTKKYHLQYAI